MTISINRLRELRSLAFLALLLSAPSSAEEPAYEFDGHVKGRLLADTFPADSVFRGLIGSSATDVETDLRLNFAADKDAWSLNAAWQLYAGHGDRIELARMPAASESGLVGSPASDDGRLMNLTDVLRDRGRTRVLHRLDRLALGYASGNVVLRIGRQAISWGNGLFFSPMDIVNPFDPTAVDTEYKAGDDMVYGQFLFESGNDLQFAHVFRRNLVTGDPDQQSATTAVKYHGVRDNSEIDLLIAENRDEFTFGIGGNRSIGGAVWRGDVLVTDTVSGNRVQVVTNLSYSWVLGGKNMSGIAEYYFSDFGQHGDGYDPASIAQNQDLVRRLARGEAFTIGRNYFAGGVLVEMNPLWTLTPNVFMNLDDGSALFQLTTRYSLSDNSDFLGALNVPMGPSGREFGGIESGLGPTYLSTDLSLFAQFAWYF